VQAGAEFSESFSTEMQPQPICYQTLTDGYTWIIYAWWSAYQLGVDQRLPPKSVGTSDVMI